MRIARIQMLTYTHPRKLTWQWTNQPFEDVFPIETMIFPGENMENPPFAGKQIHLAVVKNHHLKYPEVMIPYIFYLKH